MDQEAKDYIVKHKINELFGVMLCHVLEERPIDVTLYLIEFLTKGAIAAEQDSYGLTKERREAVNAVFEKLKEESTGLSFGRFKSLLRSDILKEEELEEIYNGLDIDEDGMISQQDFCTIIGRLSVHLDDNQFQIMISNFM